MRIHSFLPAVITPLCLLLSSCTSLSKTSAQTPKVKTIPSVRTTAYTHTEADHLIYGKKNAIGTTLQAQGVRSAAADWSVYPLGTTFKIKGQPYVYQIDDYGSALVGTNTIDIYQPSRSAMNQWGVKMVDIDVVQWGCPDESLRVLVPRTKWSHVKKMVDRLAKKTTANPTEQINGSVARAR
jgi:3D (Asp-Asp-Asp) domain-containing protein